MSNTDKKYYNKQDLIIRPAEDKDMRIIFNLANDEVVRKSSFNSAKIKLKDHKKWFKNKINHKNHLILLAEIKGTFTGQVRFEINRQLSIIGVSVCREFRGHGLGTIIIKKGLEYLKLTRPTIKRILAYIREDNPTSVKLFKKCGFKYNKKIVINGNKAFKYIYNYKK